MLKKILKPVGWMLLGVTAMLAVVIVHFADSRPDLQAWHETLLEGEIRAGNDDLDFEEWMVREDALFAKLQEFVDGRPSGHPSDNFNRYANDSRSNSAGQDPDWNRTRVLPVESPRGVALLLHGLSDSPYSLRAVGELLQASGIYTIALRLPGHGTLPAQLTETHWEDWRTAISIVARHLTEKFGAGAELPFFIAGYSTGAPLAIDYSLSAPDDAALASPTALLLFSPAIAVSPLAALARVQLGLSKLPGLEKLAWTDVLPEFDPYKYSSFPVMAAYQVYLLSENVNARIANLPEERKRALPEILAFQSVVDATVQPRAIAEMLTSLGAIKDEVVYFDVNRMSEAEDFIAPTFEGFIDALQGEKTTDFRLTVVGNRSEDSRAVVLRTRGAGQEKWSVEELDMEWPRGIYSLAHVAVPFPPSDPFYGDGSGTTENSLPLGSLELRGERGVFGIPASLMLRLRHNPFFSYVEKRVSDFVKRER